MENWQTSILLIAAVQGILLSLAMLWPAPKKHTSGAFLGIILFVLSLELLNTWGMQVRYHQSPNVLPFWLLGSYLLLPPATWLFLQLNTSTAFTVRNTHLLLFLPAAIEILTESIVYTYNRRGTTLISLLDIKAWWLATEILPVVWMVAVLFFRGKALVHIARQSPPASFPGLHPARLLTIFMLLSMLTLLWIADAVLQLPVFTGIAFMLVLLLFTLSWLAYTGSSLLEVAARVINKLPTAPVFNAYNDQEQLLRLQQVFEQAGLHRRSKLSLDELATQLDLPARYVSHLINTYHATNFHQFINGWRVQDVIRKINDPAEQHKTLLALALESGFSSKSSFNQVFKAHTGKSPSQYFGQ